jgi:NADH:ubiquinone oxidoreductase subunit H
MTERGIKEIAGGWMTERTGTDVPVFLKLSYVVIAAGCVLYAILYMNGDVNQAERGPLVQALNAATEHSDVLMWLVAGLAATFAVILWTFAFRKPHEE